MLPTSSFAQRFSPIRQQAARAHALALHPHATLIERPSTLLNLRGSMPLILLCADGTPFRDTKRLLRGTHSRPLRSTNGRLGFARQLRLSFFLFPTRRVLNFAATEDVLDQARFSLIGAARRV